MPDPAELSRRERRIMDAVFALGEATVNKIVGTIPDAPTPMAVRQMMHILEEKGYLKRREEGREVMYLGRKMRNPVRQFSAIAFAMSFITSATYADGLIYKLPPDGSWVTYESVTRLTEVKTLKGEAIPDMEVRGTFALRSVGVGTVGKIHGQQQQ